MAPRFAEQFDNEFDHFLEATLENDSLRIPGLVAMCRRGNSVYGPKAFGYADLASATPMETDAVMRMYSMTKVLTNTIALMLYEKGIFKLNDPVGEYL